MEMGSINWLAVLVAGISSFVVGGIWYSPGLFGKAWMKDNNLTEEDVKRGNKGKIFGWTFIFSLLMAVNLGMFLAEPAATCPEGCVPKINLQFGTMAGFLSVAIGLGVALGNALAGLSFGYLENSFAPPLNYALGLALFQLIFIPAGLCYYRLSKTTTGDIRQVKQILADRGQRP